MSNETKYTWFVASAAVVALAMLIYGYVEIDRKAQRDAERQRAVMANYRSPVERTDSQRLDWLTAHPRETPWADRGTDPRREIDFAMDREQEAAK